MSRGVIRKPSFNKIVGAYRSQWKRFWMRLFTFGLYGSKGVGWWRDPKKAWYNFWYNRTSISVYKILGCKPSRLACFFAMIVAAVATPVDITSAGVKAHKIKKERKKRENADRVKKATTTSSSSTVTHSSSHSSYTRPNPQNPRPNSTSAKSTSTSQKKTTAEKKVAPVVIPSKPDVAPIEKPITSYTYTPIIQTTSDAVKPISVESEQPKEPDEITPKTTPKNEKDQYIRKRMIIAGSYYCDKNILEQLTVGTYFDLEAEPDNPHDKDAVKLLYNGQKIGYIAKQDRLAFVTCLKLKRNIYGVITAIKEEDSRTQYEFETWFDSSR